MGFLLKSLSVWHASSTQEQMSILTWDIAFPSTKLMLRKPCMVVKLMKRVSLLQSSFYEIVGFLKKTFVVLNLLSVMMARYWTDPQIYRYGRQDLFNRS